MKDALSNTTSFSYDPMNRLTKITYQDTTTMQFAYDKRGRRISVTDQNNKTTQYAYDDADRLITVTDPALNATQYGYDTESNLTSIKDANSNTTTFSYDFLGRLTNTLFPSNLSEGYGYDSNGNMTSKTDRNNHTVSYTYDQLNRLKQKSYPDSTTVNYTYDNDSRLTQVTDPTGAYNFTHDNMGRLTQASSQYTFLTAKTFTSAYGYDAASNRTSYTDPEGGATTYAYDTLNRLQTLTPPSAFVRRGSFGFAYDVISRRTSLTRPNSVSSAYRYDALSHLLSVTHAAGSTTLDGANYGLDAAGNRTSRTPLPSGTTTNYGYDPIYELLSATQGSTTKESYTYDAVGNRLTSLSGNYTVNTSNEMTSSPTATFTFDNNGNVLTKTDSTGTTSYSWNFENRLTSVTLPGTRGTVTFKYDPFGRRIYKTSPSATSIYAYDSDYLIEETNSSGTVVARYAQGLNIDEPLAMLRSSVTSYYEADGLGSVTSLTNSSAAIANSYSYDSAGNLTASSGSLANSFRYTGRELDSETNLYYYRARYYDPTIGRFIGEDPIRFSSGINFYDYVGDSPLNFRDPLGLCPAPNKPEFTKRYLPPNAQTCSAILQFYAPPGFNLDQIVAAGKAGGKNPFAALAAVGQYGTFDFQRSRDSAGNTTFYSGYTSVSNVAVGAYLYGAGFSDAQATFISNTYASAKSSNAGASQQAVYRNLGYDLAAAGWNPSCTKP